MQQVQPCLGHPQLLPSFWEWVVLGWLWEPQASQLKPLLSRGVFHQALLVPILPTLLKDHPKKKKYI